MRKICLILILFLNSNMYPQIDFATGMGINFVNHPSLNKYLEYSWSDNEISAFSSTAEFYLEADYSILPFFQIGIEDVYTLYSYNYINYKLEYEHHKPSMLIYYVINGEGYKFKFGGGAGIRFVELLERKIIDEDYSTTGIGFLLRAQGHTKLSGNFYANVGSTIRFDFPGEPTNGEEKIVNNISNENINLNSFSVSVDIGISYFF